MSARPSSDDPGAAVDETAGRIVELALARAPTLGDGRLVCLDGPAGSGKTTLAAAMVRHLRDRRSIGVGLVHMDDVYDGWAGLSTGMATVASSVIEPLRHGRPGRYRRFDWHRDAYAEEHVVHPVDVLLVEGVGSGNAAYGEAVTLLVWVVAPPVVRLERGVERDGEQMRDQWLVWRVAEDAMFEQERTRDRADVVVDGITGALS